MLGILVNHLAESFLLNHGAGSHSWLPDPAAVTGSVTHRFEYFWTSGDSSLRSLAGLVAWIGNETPGVFILLSGFGLALSMSAGNRLDWFGFMRRWDFWPSPCSQRAGTLKVSCRSQGTSMKRVDEVLPRIEPDLVIDQIFTAELDWMQISAAERRREIGLQAIEQPDYRTSWIGTQLYQKALRFSGNMTAIYAGLPARWRYETSLVGYFRTKNVTHPSYSEQHVSLTRYWSNLRSRADKQGYNEKRTLKNDFTGPYTQPCPATKLRAA